MLLITSYIMIVLGQEIFTGSDLYPPTISVIYYNYACDENDYSISLKVGDLSNPEISSLNIGNSHSSDSSYLDFQSAIARYRSISSWNASCLNNTNDLILFVRGTLQSDLNEDIDRNTLTVFKISNDGKIEFKSD